jgi:hypothetical protein
LTISQQLNRKFLELKFKGLSLDITETYGNYGCRTVGKAKRENDYAGRIAIKENRGELFWKILGR